MWQATTIDEYSRIRAANIGATAATWTYNTANLLTQIKGTGVQQYDYDFNGTTANLNWRKNTLLNKTEYFAYDTGNLDRLIQVSFGSLVNDIGYDPTIKGNIISKTDAGTYTYDPTKKYAVKTITSGLNISTTPQNIVYNVFNKVAKITEGTKTAEFEYNADHQRIRMTLKTSGTTTKTRYYFGGSCEREVAGTTTTQYIWIGGDAYSAFAVAKKVGTGSWTVYNIFRDHLGTITHLKNGTNPADEYSFDAWGRRRNATNWTYDLTGQPALFADRGFTSHEFLADFNLYNMNGRLYDPVVGRFLSADPYITDPSFSQSYNRYSYCLNNPLKFTDYSGESWKSFWRGVGNWMTRNNIQFQVGVNISGNGTIPFAGISGPNNFSVSTQNFVKQPTAGIQSINQQIAMFSRMSTGVSPEWNMPMQQFVGESPLAGGVASSSGTIFGNVISSVGLTGYTVSDMDGTFRLVKSGSFSPGYYASGWSSGNQYVKNLYNASKFGTRLSTGASVITTGMAYNEIINGNPFTITYVDATVGTIGLTASGVYYLSGAQIPGVGVFVAAYGATRIGWDIGWNLGILYGPSTWFRSKQPNSRVLEYMREKGMLDN